MFVVWLFYFQDASQAHVFEAHFTNVYSTVVDAHRFNSTLFQIEQRNDQVQMGLFYTELSCTVVNSC